jgi:hypothetical protein
LLDAKSPQERAKQLAKGTNIDIIRFVVTAARRQCNEFESKQKAKEQEAQIASKELQAYAPLERAEKLTRLAEKSASTLQSALGRHEHLTVLESVLIEVALFEKLFVDIPSSDDIESYYSKFHEKQKLLQRLINFQKILDKPEVDLEPYQFIRNLGVSNHIQRLLLLQTLNKLTNEEKQTETVIKNLKKSLGNVCITCGRPL